MKKVGYLGYSLDAVESIVENSKLRLEIIYLHSMRDLKHIENYAKKNNITCVWFDDKNDLCDKLQKNEIQVDFFIIYWFGIIIPEKLLQGYEFYNFHTGDLNNNRGSSPISWSLLNQDSYTCLSLHKVTSKIDLGTLIDTYKVMLDKNDTMETVTDKLQKGIPTLLEQLIQYKDGKIEGKEVVEGLYRPPLSENDYTIKYDDQIDDISAKIRCRSMFGGAILNIQDKKYLIDKCQLDNGVDVQLLNGEKDNVRIQLACGSIIVHISGIKE